VIKYICWFALMLFTLSANADTKGEWSYFGADRGGSHYSTLKQIDKSNVDELEVAWIHRTGEAQRRGAALANEAKTEVTPILVDNKLVFCTPFNRILALDPATGEEHWAFEPEVNLELNVNYNCRGVAYWEDEIIDDDQLCGKRILFGTNDSRFFAIDAGSGKRCPNFGSNGELKIDADPSGVYPGGVQFVGPPVVIGDIAVIGSTIQDGLEIESPSGKVRAFNVRTGALEWEFDPIPRDPADPATQSWGKAGPGATGSANVWTPMSVDAENDLVFMATSTPTTDFYGGHRPGENRYANSLVALRGSSGEVVWHFQTIHHGLWDYDVGPAPMLVDLPRDGKMVPAVVQATKPGFVFVFNRLTGEALFPIEERPVPVGDVKGEWYSPTQPVPLKPPPLVPQSLKPEDVWGLTFWDRGSCRDLVASLRHEGLYTPPSTQGTLVVPATGGGPNWAGPAFDPQRNLMIINTTRIPWYIRMIPRAPDKNTPEGTVAGDDISEGFDSPMRGTPYVSETGFVASRWGAPCSAPPWGGLTAIDLSDASVKWDVTLGSIEKLMPIPIPLNWGTPNLGGPMITAGGLVFIAATMDDRIRAFDIDNGEELWNTVMPAAGHAIPMTYSVNGRQFVVIAAGGHPPLNTTRGDYIIAYALPD
jgi:quinoprotein glucose dehydrogenase